MTFLFDNNFSPRIVQKLKTAGHKVEHIKDVFGYDAKDLEFIPKMKDLGMTLVTADTSMRSRRPERIAIEQSGISVLFIHKSISSQRFEDQQIWYEEHWHAIETSCAQHPHGTLLKLRSDATVIVWPYGTGSKSAAEKPLTED